MTQLDMEAMQTMLELPRRDAARHPIFAAELGDEPLQIGQRRGCIGLHPTVGCHSRRKQELAGEGLGTTFDIHRHPAVQDINGAEGMAAIEQEVAELMCQRHACRCASSEVVSLDAQATLIQQYCSAMS